LKSLPVPRLQTSRWRAYVDEVLGVVRGCRAVSKGSLLICGPGSSIAIATDYGLEGLGSNPGGDEIFRRSRPALGPTQPPVQWKLGLSWG